MSVTGTTGDAPGALPRREGPRPRTTAFPPHTQIDPEPVPELVAAMMELCFAMPDVEERPTATFLLTSRAAWLVPDVPAQAAGFMAEREFAHIHPDGDLHLMLPAARAAEVIEAGWGEGLPVDPPDQAERGRPLASSMPPGMTLLYTPRTPDELRVIVGLLRESRDYARGE